jgi:hypothetical protein
MESGADIVTSSESGAQVVRFTPVASAASPVRR